MIIAVVFGGKSVEHDISIMTGIQTIRALDKSKYKVLPIYLSMENRFYLCDKDIVAENIKHEKLREVFFCYHGLMLKRKLIEIDACILCVHGKDLEGGMLAGYFETLDIAYTSSTILGAALAQDKISMKKVLRYDKIPLVPFITFTKEEYLTNKIKVQEDIEKFGLPIILKASNLGSSIGIKVVDDLIDLDKMMIELFQYDDRILVERKLENFVEYNIAVINQNQLSSIEEVKPENSLLTFTDKYVKVAKRNIPASINEKLKERIERLALIASSAINNKGVIRIDFLYDNIKKKLYLNEINSIPGSLAFYLFEKKGLYFDELLNRLIDNALTYKHFKNQETKEYKSNVLVKKNYIK